MALKDKYLTVSEAARIAGVSRQTISRWIAEGHLIAEKFGRQVLIDKKEFGQYLSKQNIYRSAVQIVDSFAERIRQKYKYTNEDKLNLIKLKSKENIFVFSVTRKDGTHEIVSVTTNKPEKLDSKGKPFVLVGYKFPIIKIERRTSK